MNQRGFAGVCLESPKHAVNIGSALRAVSAFDASFLVYTGRKRTPAAPTNTFKTHRHLPVFFAGYEMLWQFVPYGAVPVAIELREDAVPLVDYVHPQQAFYIFGPEDGSITRRVAERCRDRVYVPTAHCMNLAATVNVVLYDRAAKAQRRQSVPKLPDLRLVAT